jgi:hypothetical protein
VSYTSLWVRRTIHKLGVGWDAVLDDREHVVKADRTEDFQNLRNVLREAFREEVEAARILKKQWLSV